MLSQPFPLALPLSRPRRAYFEQLEQKVLNRKEAEAVEAKARERLEAAKALLEEAQALVTVYEVSVRGGRGGLSGTLRNEKIIPSACATSVVGCSQTIREVIYSYCRTKRCLARSDPLSYRSTLLRAEPCYISNLRDVRCSIPVVPGARSITARYITRADGLGEGTQGRTGPI